jgi:benzoate-CoA ligase
MYWGNRAKTRETFQGGWTKSGDKYVRNADGSYTYGGRSDDMLKVSGIYVSPSRSRPRWCSTRRCWRRP